jgi:aerobic-type carbon monoxide dehydrogenase small subunit (CoxS/CutS family)
MSQTIRFRLNGESIDMDTEGDRTLLWVLRTDLKQTGAKYGCGAGNCGSCTVIVDGEPVRSCITRLDSIQGKDVTTIEGLAQDGDLHPLQQAFYEFGGYQCGYCTPGMIMNAYGLLQKNPKPTRDEIVEGMENNLCRCSAYKRIVEAIEMASGQNGGNDE